MVKTYTKDIIATVDTKWGNVYIAESIMIDIPNRELTRAKGVQLTVNSKMLGSVFALLNSLTETQANIILLRGTSAKVNWWLYLTLIFSMRSILQDFRFALSIEKYCYLA